MRNRALFLSFLLFLTVLPSLAQGTDPETYTPPDGWPKGWYARIETSLGRIVILLLPEQSPQSVAHFVEYAQGTLEWTDPVKGEVKKEPYYDGAEVYKVTGATLFQVGDKTRSGSYTPFVYVPEMGSQPVNFNLAGRVGNVRVGPRVSAARFLITAGAMPGLNVAVPCFGVVMDGKDVVFNITAVKTHKNGRPIDPVVIREIRVFAKGDPDPLPKAVAYYPEPRLIEFEKLKTREN